MPDNKEKKRIAILGGGPSGMFMYKRLIESGLSAIEIDVFEKGNRLGAGMPYSQKGANKEHVTNVSANEIPELVTPISSWIQTVPPAQLTQYNINPDHFNEYKVLPRLLFGDYLAAQFDLLLEKAKVADIETRIHFQSQVVDIIDDVAANTTTIVIANDEQLTFDTVIICTGHYWPKRHEGKVPGYFDSPYPPCKLHLKLTNPVAVKGSSLTAIDAIRTLARQNGCFSRSEDGQLSYNLNESSAGFRIDMHSRSGLLPAVRFHLEDSHLSNNSLLTPEEITAHREGNDGFLSLDFIFEKNFKAMFLERDPAFYDRIKFMTIEEFVADMMALRETLDAFTLFKAEYVQAEKSIKRQESIYWKEMLAVLSFAMNYPAKYLAAEDMQRLQKVLMPLISIIIAFVPQQSAEELLALHNAGLLYLIPVGNDSQVWIEDGKITYQYFDESGVFQKNVYDTFVDCIGQPHLSYDDFPFESLRTAKTVSPARLKFKDKEAGAVAHETLGDKVEQDSDGNYFLKVSGIGINDHFQVLDQYGAYNSRIYIMAVPYIGGFNPDYSGLDFCEAASKKIGEAIVAEDFRI